MASTSTSARRPSATDYTVACVCPMGVEFAPVEAMLDEIHEPLFFARDQNAYTLGKIGGHNIVIAVMSEIGNNAAAATVTQLLNDFPAIRFGLLVGIGGGVPGDADVRLGDLVIGQPAGEFPGVVQYDMGKQLEGGQFQRTGSLNKPPAVLSANVRKLDGQHRRLGHQLSGYILKMVERYPAMQTEYSYPSAETQDQLFLSTYKHQPAPTCDQCDDRYTVPRLKRQNDEPRVHYGTIGSANRVIKDAGVRDRIREDTHALCVEMEAAGLMNDFPCLVIRGICDYADSHKNKQWQPYAAAVAAAYMKALLLIIPAQEVSFTGHAVECSTSSFRLGLHLIEAPLIEDDLFVGRSTELQEMENILRPHDAMQRHCRLVLGGMGGVGKTQLAIMYAKRHCNSYDSIFWLNSTSEVVLKHSIRQVAQRVLDVDKYQGQDDDYLLLYVTRWLLDTKNTRWLLVFDNYDEPEAYDIGRYCPYGAHGSAVITTRVPDQVQGRQLLVRPMEDIEQSLHILATRSQRAHVHTDSYALQLARRMQGLPLALATVGAYLKHSPWTFQEYLEKYEKQFNVDDRQLFHLSEYRNRTLYTTWDITYARLEADHPRAAGLLRSFAFFDNQHLQHKLFRISNDHSMARKLAKTRSKFLSLLRTQAKEDSLEWLSRTSIDEFDSIMHVLTEYCFVEIQSAHREYSVHSCVHDWALSSQKASDRSVGYWFAFDQIADLVDGIEADCYGHSRYSAINPHAVRLTHVSFSTIGQSASRKRLNSMDDIASFLRQQTQLDAAKQMYRRALAGKEKVLGPDHTSTLSTVNNLGVLYYGQEKLVEAEQMYQRALAGREKALGPDHTSTLETVNNLGNLYADQGKLVEAEQMYQRALAGYEKALRPDHTSTLETVNNLGVLYADQGKLVEAEQLYQRALAGYEKALGPDHTSTLSTVNNLGVLYYGQEKLVEAEQMYQRALAGYKKALGPDYTSTLDTVHNFGLLYRDQGKLVEAEQMYQRALAGYEKALGPNHTSTLRTVNNLGSLYADQGKLVEAEQMLRRVVAGRTKVFGPKHRKTSQAVNDLNDITAERASKESKGLRIDGHLITSQSP